MLCEEFHIFKTFPSSKREEIIQEGVELLQRWGKPNLSAVKQFLNEKYKTNICLGTLCNHYLGEHQDNKDAHAAQQLLSLVQENVLIEWIILLSDTGHCIRKQTV
jgi:hypothetical protein